MRYAPVQKADKPLSGKTSLFFSLAPILAILICFLSNIIFTLVMHSLISINHFTILLNLPPLVIFPIYLYKYHPRREKTLLVPIVYISLICVTLIWVIISTYDGLAGRLLSTFIRCLLLYGVPLYCSITGFSKKTLYIVFIGISLLLTIISYLNTAIILIRYFIPYESAAIISLLSETIFTAGQILFLVHLMLFGIRNSIPDLTIAWKVKRGTAPKNPAQALKMLNYRLEQGMITPEEYQQRRFRVLQKLMNQNR